MLTKIKISGFRSIKDQEIELSKINLIYGETATGKSSVLYSLLVLKNFVKNPNQHVDAFFNLGFLNLGGFDSCVFNHDPKGEIKIGFSLKDAEYEVIFKKNQAKIKQVWNKFEMSGDFSIPYPLNKNFAFDFDQEFTINWNGITSSVVPKTPTSQNQQIAREIAEKLNSITSVLDSVDIVPHKRGFFKPFYSPSAVSANPTTEDEVATIIINDPNLAPKISVDLEKILNRDFRLHTPPGTAIAYFKTTDKITRTPTDLVNDGFGVNQVVFILAKVHRPEIKTILIEEPEIHLHPKVIRALVRTIISISKEEEKQFIIVTHSELFVSSLLTAIVEKLITPADVKLYLAEKKGKETILREQKANEKKQVEGGLESFISAELEDLKIMLGIKGKNAAFN
jgi:AAA15 family ATPase/GTPase